MNKVKVYRGSDLLSEFETSIIPREKEYICLSDDQYLVVDIVYNVDKDRNRLVVNLIVDYL